MTRKIRIAQVVGNLETGGMQAVVMEIMRRLDRQRFDPFLVHFRGPNHFAQEIAEKGWECHKVSMTQRYRGRQLARLAAFLKGSAADIVHSHSHFANFAGRAAAALAGIPRTIIHYQNTYEHRLDARFRAMEEFLAPHTSLILACSHGVDEFLKKNFNLGGTPVEVLANAVPLEAYEAARASRGDARTRMGIAPGAFHIVHTARLEPHKHPERLLHALHLAETTPELSLGDWRATFVGGGSLEEELRTTLARLSEDAVRKGGRALADRVHFAGWSQEIALWLASGDAFTLVSDNEGLPLSLVEAMAAGTPAVCSDIVGPREVISDGRNGLLVEPGNVRAIAEALKRIRSEEGLRERLVEGGIQRARDYGADVFINKLEAIYERTAAGQPSNHVPTGLVGRFRFRLQFSRAVKS